jgi:aspartyl-tRNA(Asn)/glutamyl-tRNA(Gln) amidotransferase subunit A
VRDAALMLGPMARHDLRDPLCLPDDGGRDWRGGIEAGVAGLRVALVRRPGFDAPLDAEGVAALEGAARLLAEQGALVEEAEPALPDTRPVFLALWSAGLARLLATLPAERRALLDPGLAEAAATADPLSAAGLLGAEAVRIEAAHAMARFHQRHDLVLTAATPTAAFAADQPTLRPREALMRDWAPWTFLFNLTRQPAISVPVGLDGGSMPRAVQVAAALHREDLAFRAARALEVAAGSMPAPGV